MDRKHDASQIKADSDRIAQGLCPETGKNLGAMNPTQIRSHAAHLFPAYDPSQNGGSDYERRARLVLRYADEREQAAKEAK